MPPKTSTPMDQPRHSIMSSSDPVIDNLTPSQLESYFLHMLSECNRLSRNDEIITREIAMGKMVNYCIRMLHSNGWVPRTVIRTMVHMEAEVGSERSVKGLMYQAMREKRDEGRARRIAKANSSAVAEIVDAMESHGFVKNEVVNGNETNTGAGNVVDMSGETDETVINERIEQVGSEGGAVETEEL